MDDIEERHKARKKKIQEEAAPSVHKLEVFRYDANQNGYWNIESGEYYETAIQVDALVPREYWPKVGEDKKGEDVLGRPSAWLRDISNRHLVQRTVWWPGRPRFILNTLFHEGSGADEPRNGYTNFNNYDPPLPLPKRKGPPPVPARWLEHVRKVYPNEAETDYLFDYCAHMLQKPEEKCNNVVTLSGPQGIGKDTILQPLKFAVGHWNVEEIDPDDLAGNYTTYYKCIMLVINEMRSTKEDFQATSLYEKIKRFAVSPPDILRVRKKYFQDSFVRNVLRTFITTNDMNAMFIHPDDRRMSMILHSILTKDWATEQYFNDLHDWMEKRGNLEVAHWLMARDISKFNAKARAAPTTGFKSVVAGWQPPQDAITNALDRIGYPDVFFSSEILNGYDDIDEIRSLMKLARKFQHRLRQSGYMRVNFDPVPYGLVFKSDKKRLNFQYGFIKSELINEEEKYKTLFNQRGEALVNGLIPTGPKGTDDGGDVPTIM